MYVCTYVCLSWPAANQFLTATRSFHDRPGCSRKAMIGRSLITRIWALSGAPYKKQQAHEARKNVFKKPVQTCLVSCGSCSETDGPKTRFIGQSDEDNGSSGCPIWKRQGLEPPVRTHYTIRNPLSDDHISIYTTYIHICMYTIYRSCIYIYIDMYALHHNLTLYIYTYIDTHIGG